MSSDCKIYDTFLFFNELDLLEIRLNYLADHVDKFVIVESCQTFTGNPKPFYYENNSERFKKFHDKIIHIKIKDSHQDYNSLTSYLSSNNSEINKKLFSIMDNHVHYSKEVLHWVLDSYHRECIHIGLSQYAKDEDIILLSDLDEIPSAQIFSFFKENQYKVQSQVCLQKEFRYFLNYFYSNNWLGTIFGNYHNIKNLSLNELRVDSKEKRTLVSKALFEDGGYHFTSCGGVEMIIKKIKSWGHQEFNTKAVLENISYNISTGQDIFQRETGTKLKLISLDDSTYFDQEMNKLIKLFPKLYSEEKILDVKRSVPKEFRYFLKKVKDKLFRILNLS